jgi:hypothetical protein
VEEPFLAGYCLAGKLRFAKRWPLKLSNFSAPEPESAGLLGLRGWLFWSTVSGSVFSGRGRIGVTCTHGVAGGECQQCHGGNNHGTLKFHVTASQEVTPLRGTIYIRSEMPSMVAIVIKRMLTDSMPI